MDREAFAAARVVTNQVLDIQEGETVLITNDSPKTRELSSLLASAVWEAGAIPVELFMTKLARPGSPPPSLVAHAARQADVWIELNEIYILGTPADHDARRAGTRRFYSLSGMTVHDLILLELDVDRLALAELGERLGELTTGRQQLSITCENGSDFTASIRDCVATPDTTTMPLGQTHISPVEESVSGRLVFDGSAFPPESLAVLRETISVEFSDGVSRVTGGGREAQVLANWREWNDDPGIHRLNHVSYGYHPNVPFPTGRLVCDERVFGCLCIGFGPPQPYTCHSDLTILGATVHVDDEPIQTEGRYTDPGVRRLARSLSAPGY
ncbi:MAG: hypothetical protein OXF41_05290 [bacterium]|nr:hypothetical protein [bacterium]